MYTFLYCFDNNYNQQAFTSIISLLDKSTSEIIIYIIHSSMSDKNEIPKNILQHPNLLELELFKFKKDELIFPNISGKHISEATYYRMYFEKYIKSSVQKVIYVDSDIIFLKCPLKDIRSKINELDKSNYTLCAKTEHNMFANNLQKSEDLNIKSLRYFNAGFMIIDVFKWRNEDTEEKLIKLQNSLLQKIEYWDQDILNSYFDGKYVELSNMQNYFIDLALDEINDSYSSLDDAISIHYIGKTKPWSIRGILQVNSVYFQNAYRLLSKNQYLITNTVRTNSLKILLKSIFSLKFLNVDKPISFVLSALRSFV